MEHAVDTCNYCGKEVAVETLGDDDTCIACADHDHDDSCPACAGTGEGSNEYARCHACKGKGFLLAKSDDFDAPDDGFFPDEMYEARRSV